MEQPAHDKELVVLPGITVRYGQGGISATLHFDNQEEEAKYRRDAEKLRNILYQQYNPAHEIRSQAVRHLTTQALEPFKELLLRSGIEHGSLVRAVTHQKAVCENTTAKLQRLQRNPFRFLLKKKQLRLEEQVAYAQQELSALEARMPYTLISLEIDSEDTYQELYQHVVLAFRLLLKSEKKWDVTSAKHTNRVQERTSATSVITRTDIDLQFQALHLIRNSTTPLCFHNANGGDLFFYPGFLVVHENNNDFAIIDYTELEVKFGLQRFIEDQKVPSDTSIVDHTWNKVNKDGSPDRRFANNRKIPVVLYGDVHFRSATGLNEKYSFSNAEMAGLFARALNDYIDALKTARAMLSAF